MANNSSGMHIAPSIDSHGCEVPIELITDFSLDLARLRSMNMPIELMVGA